MSVVFVTIHELRFSTDPGTRVTTICRPTGTAGRNSPSLCTRVLPMQGTVIGDSPTTKGPDVTTFTPFLHNCRFTLFGGWVPTVLPVFDVLPSTIVTTLSTT